MVTSGYLSLVFAGLFIVATGFGGSSFCRTRVTCVSCAAFLCVPSFRKGRIMDLEKERGCFVPHFTHHFRP